jgi:spore germination protein KC
LFLHYIAVSALDGGPLQREDSPVRKVLLVLLGFIGLLLLPGCWDKLEIEEQAFSVVIGVDPKEGSGITVTYQIANPQVGSSDRSSAPEEPASEIVTFEAPDLITARDLANTFITRSISFSHTQTLIVSEKFASGEQFKNFIGSSIRDRQLRREVNIIVTKESAADFIRSNKPVLETRPHKFFDFMEMRWDETGLVPYSTLNRLFQRTEGDDTLFLAIYATGKQDVTRHYGNEDEYLPGEVVKEGGHPLQFVGSAVFRNGRMVGVMDGEDTRLSLLLRPRPLANNWLTTYKDPLDPKYRVGVRQFKRKATRIHLDTSNDKTRIQVTVPLTLHLVSIPSLTDYLTNADNQETLKRSIEKQLTDEANELIKRTQTEFLGEPFTWYLEARKHFWTVQQYKAYDWMEQYPHAEVEVKFDVTIQQFGKQLQPFEMEWKKGDGL